MKTFLCFSFILLSAALSAQTIQCPKGDCGRFSTFVGAAQTAAKGRNFEEAINQYNAAKVCCPSATDSIDAEILRVFELIENEKKISDENAVRAKKAEVKANDALKKANRLIDHFYFTQNRAWAYKNGKFAIIDRDGNLKSKFIYDRPDNFQANGYALVYKGKHQLLIDVEGNESPEYKSLFPTNSGGYWVEKDSCTFTDFRGQIPPDMGWYKQIDTFSSGMARVLKDSLWGYIDATGKLKIPAKFSNSTAFKEGMAWVEMPKKGWGLIDRNGNFLIEPTYSNAQFVTSDISFVTKRGKWGVIDKAGNYVVKAEYDQVTILRDSTVRVWKDGKSGLIDKTGKYIVELKYDDVGFFQNGMVKVWKGGKCGFVNEKGEEAIPPQFKSGDNFSEGFALVRVDSASQKFIDKKGNFRFPSLQIENAFSFYEGLAPIKEREGKFGYIDSTGKYKINPQYEQAFPFSKGIAWVKLEKESLKGWGIIDTEGKLITDTLFEKYRYSAGKFTAVKQGDKWGFITSDGKVLVPPAFEEVQNFAEGYAAVKQNGLWGFIDSTGKVIGKIEYSEAGSFFEGMAAVQKDNKWGFINTTGSLIVPIKFTQLYSSAFENGVIWLYVDEDRGFRLINRKGEFVGDVYDNMRYGFSEGLGAAVKRDKWGFVDTMGKEVIPFIYNNVGTFQEGLATFNTDDAWGYINKKGEVVFSKSGKSDLWQNRSYYGRSVAAEGLIAVQDSGKWGFIDSTGKWAIPARYDELSGFYKGYVRVMEGAQTLFIDKNNKIIVRCPVSNIYIDGVDGKMVKFYDNYYGRSGFLNLSTGKLIGPLSGGEKFSNGVIWVREYDNKEGYYKMGLMDENGEYLIPSKRYGRTKDFENEVAWVLEDESWWLIDKQGNRITKEGATSVGEFSEGLARANQSEWRTFVDTSGQFVIKIEMESGDDSYGYRSVDYYPEDYEGYYNSGEYSYSYDGYNTTASQHGSYQRLPFMEAASKSGDFSEGLAGVRKGEKWGYIDKTGAFKIPEKFDWAGNFSEGLAWVREGEKRKLITLTGDYMNLSKNYEEAFPFSGGVAVVIDDEDNFGMIDRNGKEIVPLEYQALAYFSEGLAAAKKDGKWGYINQKGEEVIPIQFDVVFDFKQGKATVQKDGIYFIINKKGQLIVDESLERQPSASGVPDDSEPPSGNR